MLRRASVWFLFAFVPSDPIICAALVLMACGDRSSRSAMSSVNSKAVGGAS